MADSPMQSTPSTSPVVLVVVVVGEEVVEVGSDAVVPSAVPPVEVEVPEPHVASVSDSPQVCSTVQVP